MACACPSGLQNPKDRGPSNGDRPRSCADPRSLAGEQVGEQVASSLKIGGDHFTVLVGITSPPQIHRIDLVRYDRIQFAHLAPLFHHKCVCVCVFAHRTSGEVPVDPYGYHYHIQVTGHHVSSSSQSLEIIS